jgi:hypothetical protein
MRFRMNRFTIVETSLRRLQGSLRGFVAPSTAFRDVDELRAQIELRRRALRDIEIIRNRLFGTILRCESKSPNRRLRGGGVGRPRLRTAYRTERSPQQF